MWLTFPKSGLSKILFQLTHPWGCDKSPLCNCFCRSIFQLTHPWGCDLDIIQLRISVGISTHTPVKVWPKRSATTSLSIYFNSHTREGVTVSLNCLIAFINFNSHTREGVTKAAQLDCILNYVFQLTHPWGCDILVSLSLSEMMKFQLTHPWGCDFVAIVWKLWKKFQLTYPWGCDGIWSGYFSMI